MGYIAAILELLKTQMPTGIPDLGIPPLDPFEVPHFDIDPIEVSDPVPININITIDDFVIKNLATFETQLAHLDLEGLGLELNLTLADLRGDATYSLDGTALGIFPIYGNGPMYLELFGVTLHAKAAVLINSEGFVEITEMDIAADFDDIAIHLDDLVGGGNFGETINNILNLGPDDLGPGEGLPLPPPGRHPPEGAERRPRRVQHCRPRAERQLFPGEARRHPQEPQ